MQARFGGELSRIVDQATVKDISMKIFERTFAVSAALNALTLLVSAIALLATLTTLANLRVAQLAPVWAVGVSRSLLSWLELARILFFALATSLLAIPLGVAMAWLLVDVVNVRAFGWRLPFHSFPDQWGKVVALALGAAVIAAFAPTLRLKRASAARLLQIFANES